MHTNSRRLRSAHAAEIIHDPRWAAVLARDARSDGRFVYSVRTTGVYCRPSCPSRRANPENVRFYATCGDADYHPDARSYLVPYSFRRLDSFAGYESGTWYALWAPKGTPVAIVAKLNAALGQALDDADVRRRLTDLGQVIPAPDARTPEALRAHQKAEIEKWWPIVKAARIKPE